MKIASNRGRRSRMKKKEYAFNPRYVYIELYATARRCYIHPHNVATHWELNTNDNSYKRPVCEGCAQ